MTYELNEGSEKHVRNIVKAARKAEAVLLVDNQVVEHLEVPAGGVTLDSPDGVQRQASAQTIHVLNEIACSPA